MHNERSGAHKQRNPKDEEVLSATAQAAFERGQILKRYVRAAAALQGMYDDTAIGRAAGRTRIAVGKWWTGVQPEPDALDRLASATGLQIDELTMFVYFNGPAPTLPQPGSRLVLGAETGVQRGRRSPAPQGPDTPSQSPGQRPPGTGRGHE